MDSSSPKLASDVDADALMGSYQVSRESSVVIVDSTHSPNGGPLTPNFETRRGREGTEATHQSVVQ